MKAINQKAPLTCSKAITINASHEKVWKTLSGIHQWSAWNPGIKNVKLKGRIEAGTVFDWKSAGVNIHSTLHTVEPDVFLGWTGKALGTFAIHNWTLSENNGLTTVVCDESMEGLLVRLFKRSFTRNVEKGMQDWLDLLKKKCEAE